MSDKQLIRDVKHKLSCYKFYTKQIFQWELEIEARETQINGVSSGSPKKLPEGNTEDKDWRSPLYDEITEFERLIANNSLVIDQVHAFVKRLELNDRGIIDKLYLRTIQLSQEKTGEEHGYTKRGIQKRVTVLITKYWEY